MFYYKIINNLMMRNYRFSKLLNKKLQLNKKNDGRKINIEYFIFKCHKYLCKPMKSSN